MIDTKALREKVLDLAIRGKLVPQDSNDEPASVLLERIRAEKEQMVKDGKLKAKDIKNDTIIFKGDDNLHYEQFPDGTVKCIEDEIPFDVPDGWCWARLNCVVDVRDGTHDTPQYVSSGVPLITSKNLCEGGIDYTNVKFISEQDAENINIRSGVDVGDILYAMIGTIGNPALIKENILISIKNVALFKFDYSLNLYNEYILLFLQYAQKDMKYNASGGLQPFVSLSYLRNYFVPIPPIKEQHKISNAYKNIEFNIDLIEKNKSTTIDLISAIKSKILDLAIRGKLVPQNPDDEPASVLLERIRAKKEELIKHGKIKRDKKESVIFKGEDNSYYEKVDGNIIDITEEIPFTIPENWCWCRLNTLCIKEIKRGKAPKYTEKSNTLVFAQKCNTKKGSINISLAQYLDENVLKKYPPEFFMKYNDIVINSTGTGTLGRVGIFEKCDDIYGLPIVPDSHITTIRVSELIVAKYIYALLKLKQPYLETAGEGSTNQKELRPEVLSNILIPLPPFLEQKQIVSTINLINIKLDEIEQSLN